MNRWLRRIWFVNGIGLLIFLALFAYERIERGLRPSRDERGPIVGKKLDDAIAESLAIQDISMSLPRRIGHSTFQFIEFSVKDLTEPVFAYATIVEPTEPYYSHERNVLSRHGAINLVFMGLDGSNPHLLLNKKGFIAAADIPGERDSLQGFNIYRIVLKDTDDDGRLTRLDRFNLYCSDINGRNLYPITGDSLRVLNYTKSVQDDKVYIKARVQPENDNRPEADWPEHIYVHDLRSNLLSSFFSDPEILKEARRLLQSD